MNPHAEQELEIMVGSDRIVRVNVDGVCVLRIRLGENAELYMRGAIELVKRNGGEG